MDCINYNALKERLKNAEEMTVPQLLDKISGEMCDKYCKFPDQASKESKDEDYLYRTYCDKCPMNKLT